MTIPLGVRRVWGPPDRCLLPPGDCGYCMRTVLYHETRITEGGQLMCRCLTCKKVRSSYDARRRARNAALKGITIKPRPEMQRPRMM